MREMQGQIEILSHCIFKELSNQLSKVRFAAKALSEVALKRLDMAKRIACAAT